MNIRLALLARAPLVTRLGETRLLSIVCVVLTIALIVAMLITASLSNLPDLKAISDTNQRKAVFFDFLMPIVEDQNNAILAQRERLLDIEKEYRSNQRLSFMAKLRLKALARDYAVEWDDKASVAMIDELKRRVDLVPVPLVLVQAAKESGWGTSRFALEGNNLFGQWCYTPGCGIVPSKRSAGASHEVQVFDSVDDAIAAYLHNINTGRAYKSLRQIRAGQRRAGKRPEGKRLADGLLYYSERRQAYVDEVKQMLQQYHRFEAQRQG